MKIAIPSKNSSFKERWISYLDENNIDYRIVNVFDSDIIQQISDCDVFLWHFYQASPKDTLFAKQLLYSLQISGKKVFPDFHTMWHFDDKVGQKYLLESIDCPLVPSFVFYSKKDAKKWAEETNYPKVFKLRSGAGSSNVKLIKTSRIAKKHIRKAFSRGFPQSNPWSGIKERWRKFKLGNASLSELTKGFLRFFIPTEYSKIAGKEKGYIYFQEFIPDNNFDIRIIVIDNKAFAIKRMVRENDFRASGSGEIIYEKEHFREDTIKLAFEVTEKLKAQCLAFDFVYLNEKPLIVEISYGFSPDGYDNCPGYWDNELTWHNTKFNPYGWIINTLKKQ